MRGAEMLAVDGCARDGTCAALTKGRAALRGQGSEFKNLEGGNAGPVTEGQRQEGGGADPEAEGGGLRLPAASPGQQRA
eukprot:723700-Rhodomonas_salina.1